MGIWPICSSFSFFKFRTQFIIFPKCVHTRNCKNVLSPDVSYLQKYALSPYQIYFFDILVNFVQKIHNLIYVKMHTPNIDTRFFVAIMYNEIVDKITIF